MIKRKLLSRDGDIMVGMVLAIILMLLTVNMLFKLKRETEVVFEQRMVIEQMAIIGKAVRGYMEANNGTLTADATILATTAGTKTLDISDAAVQTLLKPYFPAGITVANLPTTNIWGDTYRIALVRSPDASGIPTLDVITGYLYSMPGALNKKSRVATSAAGNRYLKLGQRQTAYRGGALFGWCAVAGTLQGLSWQIAGLPGLQPGYLGYIINFGDRSSSMTALQRFDSGDPEMNRMHTNIDMNDYDLDKVASIQLMPSVQPLSAWESDCINNTRTHTDGTVETGVNNVGRLFYSDLGNSSDETINNSTLAICRQVGGSRGLAFIGDSQVEESIKFVTIAKDGDTIPKPICPGSTAFGNPSGGTVDGSPMSDGLSHSRIFIVPQILSSGAQSLPMSAVKVWAIDNTTSWTVRINTLVRQNSNSTWYGSDANDGGAAHYNGTVNPDLLKVVVMGICSSKTATY